MYLRNIKTITRSLLQNNRLRKGFLIVRSWSEVIDVGLFRQMESEVIYNYQIKFSDDDRHTFDLRGNYPTIAFKEKIEEFWFKYNS